MPSKRAHSGRCPRKPCQFSRTTGSHCSKACSWMRKVEKYVQDGVLSERTHPDLTRRLYIINVFYDNRQTPQDRMPKTSLDFLFSLITYAKENNYG